jgi:uncharacterized protein YyaL (SSP411 family)
MAGGGMYDHVEGGFFRYSTTRDFSVPHFEKMLEDLGGLLLACARAGSAFGNEDLSRVAIDVRRYLDAHLWQQQFGAYGGSQDADEVYYTRDAAGRAELSEPYVDPTIYTSWNAETARALLIAGPLLAPLGVDGSEWARKGLRVLETLWSKLLDDGLMCRYFDGTPHLRGRNRRTDLARTDRRSPLCCGSLVRCRRGRLPRPLTGRPGTRAAGKPRDSIQ